MGKVGREQVISLGKLTKRLRSIGINLRFTSNIPWLYLHKVNGKLVKEVHMSDHGYLVGYTGLSKGVVIYDMEDLFNTIRKYR